MKKNTKIAIATAIFIIVVISGVLIYIYVIKTPTPTCKSNGDCSNNGECVDGKCNCGDEFTGGICKDSKGSKHCVNGVCVCNSPKWDGTTTDSCTENLLYNTKYSIKNGYINKSYGAGDLYLIDCGNSTVYQDCKMATLLGSTDPGWKDIARHTLVPINNSTTKDKIKIGDRFRIMNQNDKYLSLSGETVDLTCNNKHNISVMWVSTVKDAHEFQLKHTSDEFGKVGTKYKLFSYTLEMAKYTDNPLSKYADYTYLNVCGNGSKVSSSYCNQIAVSFGRLTDADNDWTFLSP
jgi:hypothetical protein